MPLRDLDGAARAVPAGQALPDVRAHRGVSRDVSAARKRSTGVPTPSARRSRTARSWCCAPTAPSATPTSPASWCSAVHWSRRATGTIRRRLPSVSVRCPDASRVSCLPEIAVFSGDTVRTDDEGFLYFVGRRDEMIKSSGYRISPNEVEEVALRHWHGRPSAPRSACPMRRSARLSSWSSRRLPVGCARRREPTSAVPRASCPPTWCRRRIELREGPLPRNANGKIDRKSIATELRRPL